MLGVAVSVPNEARIPVDPIVALAVADSVKLLDKVAVPPLIFCAST